jgi:hypothetical protein
MGIFMEVENLIWNTFQAGNFFQISTDFELIKGFYETDLNGVWSDRLIEIFTPNAPELHFGQ